MSQDNARRIREMYAAFARGDADAVMTALDPDVVWNEAENFAYADGNPYIGPQQVAKGVFARLGSEWDHFAVEPEQIVDGGDTVVGLGRYRGTHRTSGRPVDAQFAHVWTLRGGRVVGFQQYTDTAQFASTVQTTVPPPVA